MLVVAALGVVLVLVVAGLHLGAAAVAAHRARAAADLAALAGASALQDGRGGACARAAAVVSSNGATLTACDVGSGDTVTVSVTREVAIRWPGVPDHAKAAARAGPVDVAR